MPIETCFSYKCFSKTLNRAPFGDGDLHGETSESLQRSGETLEKFTVGGFEEVFRELESTHTVRS